VLVVVEVGSPTHLVREVQAALVVVEMVLAMLGQQAQSIQAEGAEVQGLNTLVALVVQEL
jgi:hypothetical protein